MDRDAVHRALVRLLNDYKSKSFAELVALADADACESSKILGGELVTLRVKIRSLTPGTVEINASAFGNNWFKHDRLDESLTVHEVPKD